MLFYYGEAGDATPIETHLSHCEQCRAEYRSVQTVLNTIDSVAVPERGADYGSAVWARLEKRAGGFKNSRAKIGWFSWWIWAPVAAALLLLAFFAGRISRPEAPVIASKDVRDRVLLVAVGDHLERSQMVLAEISNAPESKGKVDISEEQRMAEDLIDSNRLYRQTANNTGAANMAGVLDDLERMLLEIANSPSEIDSDELDELRQEIKDRGLLFKIRVIGSKVQWDETAPAPKHDKKEGTEL